MAQPILAQTGGLNSVFFFQIYVGVGAIACCLYLYLFLRDRTTTLTDKTSWLVLIAATLLWPIVLPISLKTELLPRWRARSRRSPAPPIPTLHQRESELDTKAFDAFDTFEQSSEG